MFGEKVASGSFWNNRRVMVTGGNGFLGKNLVRKLYESGANLEHPGEFFYDNLMMRTQLIHESWKAGVSKLLALGTMCA